MLQSQRLHTIEEILLGNKSTEFSFNAGKKLQNRDKMNSKYRQVIESKYMGFDDIDGMYMYTWVLGDNIFLNLGRLMFKRSVFTGVFPASLDNGISVDTILKIQDNKKFIESLLRFIDNEKKNHHLKNEKDSQKYVLDKIKSSQGKLGVSEFPVSFTVKEYLGVPVLIFEELQKLQESYEIKNIQIFQGKITFSLSHIGDKKIDVNYTNKKIKINNQPIFFKKMDSGNKTEEIFCLVFNYFSEYKVSFVSYYDLEKYYKENPEYNTLYNLKFSDEGVHGYLSAKNSGIEKTHGLSNFLANNVSGIYCEYYTPLKD